MAANKKLTPLISGRTIHTVSQIDALATISFTDGSSLMIKTGSPLRQLELQNLRVQKVRQSGTQMSLDFEDGATAEIELAEATSSVMLRDGRGVLEYAD